MAVNILPEAELLRQLLEYDPETGSIRHRQRPRSMFVNDRLCNSWNSRCAGKSALSEAKGYYTVRLFRKNWAAHRIAYKIFHGTEPPPLLDHKNRNGLDNRIDNIRSATKSQNASNASARRDSETGIRGVYAFRIRGQAHGWASCICVKGKTIHLGTFRSIEAAKAAYDAASIRHFGEFASCATGKDPLATLYEDRR
jgi:hypothetical protein